MTETSISAQIMVERETNRATVVLLVFLAIDAVFLAIHIWLSLNDALGTTWNVKRDNSIPEMWQYAKWVLLIGFCAMVFHRDRSGPYFVWILLFGYFLVDDSLRIHEQMGNQFVALLDLVPALGLRGVDFGELATTAIAAVILFGLMLLAYRRTDNENARRFTRRMAGLVVAIAFFGVGVDMADIIVSQPTLKWALGILEDSGEMAVASIMVACGYRHVRSLG